MEHAANLERHMQLYLRICKAIAKTFRVQQKIIVCHAKTNVKGLVDGSQIEYFSDEFNELCTQVSHAIL